MDITISFRFPLGRYHANPWGEHVNTGAVEIPPSPWRILRACYATAKTRLPDTDDTLLEGLLGRLCGPPIYHVPPMHGSHTRHYYPDITDRSGKASTDATIDAFAVINPDDDLAVTWNTDLTDTQYTLLHDIAEAIPYLGRADSICTATVHTEWTKRNHHTRWDLIDRVTDPHHIGDTADVLAPTEPLDIAALTTRPIDIRAAKHRYPPSTRHLAYCQHREPGRAAEPQGLFTPPKATAQVTAVRYAIVSTPLPPDTETVAVTDRLRAAAQSKLGDPDEGESALSGKNPDGTPLDRQHQHGHYLAFADSHHRVTELLVWAPASFSPRELKALHHVEELYQPEARPRRLRLQLTAAGPVDQVAPELTGPATTWTTSTPLATNRHYRHDWDAFIRKEVTRELTKRGYPEPASVSLDHDPSWTRWRRHRPTKRRTPRHHRSHQGIDTPATWATVTFDQPQTGPISLGHLSHFGLGLLHPQ